MGSLVVDFLGSFVADMLVEGTGRAILSVVSRDRPHGTFAATIAGIAFWLSLLVLTALIIWGILLA